GLGRLGGACPGSRLHQRSRDSFPSLFPGQGDASLAFRDYNLFGRDPLAALPEPGNRHRKAGFFPHPRPAKPQNDGRPFDRPAAAGTDDALVAQLEKLTVYPTFTLRPWSSDLLSRM